MSSKIISNYLPELFALLFGRPKPNHVAVNLTSLCNQNCIYCEIGSNIPSSRKGFLTKEDLKWIIDEMDSNNIPKISFNGGEPFLFDGMIDLVAYAGKKNIHCSITTNGMNAYKLNERNLNTLKENKADINISIDSFKGHIQSFTRGTPTALSNALKSVKVLSENSIPVTILAAISKYNYNDLFNFITVANEKKIKQVLFQPIIYYSNFPDRSAINNKSQLNVGVEQLDELINELNKILRFERKHTIRTNVYRIIPWIEQYLRTASDNNGEWFFKGVLNKFYCREIYSTIDITYDGGIQPCGLSIAKNNIYENKHLGLIGQWAISTRTIKKDIKSESYHDYCNGCCHKFSKNMMASMVKYPIKNRHAILKMSPFLFSRVLSKLRKRT